MTDTLCELRVPACPACDGEGRLIAYVLPPNGQMTSPCEMEGEVECEDCAGTGWIDEVTCECGVTVSLVCGEDHAPHFCELSADRVVYRCEVCRAEPELHYGECSRVAAADAADRVLEPGR